MGEGKGGWKGKSSAGGVGRPVLAKAIFAASWKSTSGAEADDGTGGLRGGEVDVAEPRGEKSQPMSGRQESAPPTY